MSVGRDYSVYIVAHYRLDGLGIKSRWVLGFPHLSRLALGLIQPPVHRVSGHFPGLVWLGCGINHTPPSSAKVKERVEVYLYSLCVSSWQVIGRTSRFLHFYLSS